MKFSAIVTFIKINYYLISRIHRLHSSWCFSTLGKAKKVQAFASDEWLHAVQSKTVDQVFGGN